MLNRLGCALFALGRRAGGPRSGWPSRSRSPSAPGYTRTSRPPTSTSPTALHLAGHGAEALATGRRAVGRSPESRTGQPQHRWLDAIDALHPPQPGRDPLRPRRLARGRGGARGRRAAAGRGRARRTRGSAARSWRSARGRRRAGSSRPRARRGAAARRARAAVHRPLAVLRGRARAAGRATSTRARAAVDHGIDRIQFCSEDGSRIAIIATAGTHRRGRGRRARSRPRRRRGRARPRSSAPTVPGRARPGRGRGGRGRPVEGALAWRSPRPSWRGPAAMTTRPLWAAAAAAWEADRAALPARAIARWRQAQAELAAGDRDAARPRWPMRAPPREPLGATWLATEVEGLAARGRLNLTAAAESRLRDRRRPPSRCPSVSPRASSRCSQLVAAGAPTARSASGSSWPRRRPASTSRGSSPSSTFAVAPRPPRSPTATASAPS